MSELATKLFVLPFVLLAWAFGGIRRLIRHFRLQSEVYEWEERSLRRGDRVVSVETPFDKEFPKRVEAAEAGTRVDLYCGAGQTGTVACGTGMKGIVAVDWDPQNWLFYTDRREVFVPSFRGTIHMEYLRKR